MTVLLERSDVAPVPAMVMAVALSAVVQSGKAGVFFQGADADDRNVVEAAFWDAYDGNTTEGGMALIRLWALVDVLQARRLQNQLLQRGFRFIEAAAIAAGDLRLNLDWGFMPQRLFWAIDALETERAAQRPAPTRVEPLELAVLPLAA